MKIITVVKDSDGDLWVRTGEDRWTMTRDLNHPVDIERHSGPYSKLNKTYGPLEVVAEVEL